MIDILRKSIRFTINGAYYEGIWTGPVGGGFSREQTEGAAQRSIDEHFFWWKLKIFLASHLHVDDGCITLQVCIALQPPNFLGMRPWNVSQIRRWLLLKDPLSLFFNLDVSFVATWLAMKIEDGRRLSFLSSCCCLGTKLSHERTAFVYYILSEMAVGCSCICRPSAACRRDINSQLYGCFSS